MHLCGILNKQSNAKTTHTNRNCEKELKLKPILRDLRKFNLDTRQQALHSVALDMRETGRTGNDLFARLAADPRIPLYSVSDPTGDFTDPGAYALNDIEFVALSDAQDEEWAAKFDLGRRFAADNGEFTVQVGFKGRWRDKTWLKIRRLRAALWIRKRHPENAVAFRWCVILAMMLFMTRFWRLVSAIMAAQAENAPAAVRFFNR